MEAEERRNTVNDVFENIYLRRSVRDYKPNDVPDDIIRELISGHVCAVCHESIVEVRGHQEQRDDRQAFRTGEKIVAGQHGQEF
jgi:hypothetical protein